MVAQLSCEFFSHTPSSHVTYLIKSPDDEVEVGSDLAKLMPAKDLIDELHLLNVREEVPVVHRQVGCNLTRAILLGEGDYRLLVLVRK